MNTFSSTLPALSSYTETLIRQRRDEYTSELTILRTQAARLQWQAEAAQIAEEMTQIVAQPISALAPDSDVFHALACARSRYNRDVAQMLRAASIPAVSPHPTWAEGLIQKVIAFLFPAAEAPARRQPAMA